MNKNKNRVAWLITVASLGFFVDTADLIIASLVRASSIKALGLATDDTQIKTIGLAFETWQSWGFRHILGKLPTKTTYYFHYQYITSQKIEFRQNPILEHFLKHRPINRILPES